MTDNKTKWQENTDKMTQFTAILNFRIKKLLYEEQQLAKNKRSAFEAPSAWSHAITKVRAKIELLKELLKENK